MSKAPFFYHRLAFISLALMVCVVAHINNLVFPLNTTTAVYSNPSNQIIVSVSGEVRCSGIYHTSANSMTVDVITMAGVGGDTVIDGKLAGYNGMLLSGHAINVSIDYNGTAGFIVGLMPVRQRLVLGIPLDINDMSLNDFDLVPGVGPGLAKTILEYRQSVGGIMCRDDLSNISGIGSKKYHQLKNYFK